MAIVHRLIGFDKTTEWIADEVVVSDTVVAEARRLAGASARWQDEPGCVPLSSSIAHQISALVNHPIEAERYDWFLEPAEG